MAETQVSSATDTTDQHDDGEGFDDDEDERKGPQISAEPLEETATLAECNLAVDGNRTIVMYLRV